MAEHDREVDLAVTALTAEILKLTPLEGDARAALSVTIENAISRLALAILAQSNSVRSEAVVPGTLTPPGTATAAPNGVLV